MFLGAGHPSSQRKQYEGAGKEKEKKWVGPAQTAHNPVTC